MDDCELWMGAIDSHGYGVKRFWGKARKAHRVVFFLANGWWPEVVRHKCENRSCVNPDHLEGGTQADNIRDRDGRGRNFFSSRDHCSAGHEYTVESTYVRPGTNHRQCRICNREWNRKRRQKA